MNPVTPRTWLRPAAAMFVVGWGANMFAPLLDVYRGALSGVETTGLFAAYVIGLIPALVLVAPLSDRWGRRAIIRPVLVLAVVASIVFAVSGNSFVGLLVGRVLVGVAAGGAFGPGTAWVKELSDQGGAGSSGARRAAISLTGGFLTGPFVSGILAQWLPLPEVLPWLVHIALVIVAAVVVWGAPETVAPRSSGSAAPPSRLGQALRSRPFRAAVLPTAPWVFGAASAALAALPGQVDLHGFTELGSGVVAAITLGTGIVVQPWARRAADRSRARPFAFGLGALVLGMTLGAVTVLTHDAVLLALASVALGAAYGFLLISGLGVVESLAGPGDLASLTGIFYSVTYVGFAFPLLDSVFAPIISGPAVFVVAAAIGAAAFAGLAVAWRPRVVPAE